MYQCLLAHQAVCNCWVYRHIPRYIIFLFFFLVYISMEKLTDHTIKPELTSNRPPFTLWYLFVWWPLAKCVCVLCLLYMYDDDPLPNQLCLASILLVSQFMLAWRGAWSCFTHSVKLCLINLKFNTCRGKISQEQTENGFIPICAHDIVCLVGVNCVKISLAPCEVKRPKHTVGDVWDTLVPEAEKVSSYF